MFVAINSWKHLKTTIAGLSNDEIYNKVMDEKIPCPKCKKLNWTQPRFNLMFKTYQGVLEDTAAQIYLRPETAQGIFVNFKNILDSMRVRLPFGVGQYGNPSEMKSLRVTLFSNPSLNKWRLNILSVEQAKEYFDRWVEDSLNFYALGIKKKMRVRNHEKRTVSLFFHDRRH